MLIYVFGRSVEKWIKKWQIQSFQSEKIIKAKVNNLGDEKFQIFQFLSFSQLLRIYFCFFVNIIWPIGLFLPYRSN